jgi:hypothetical protein
MQRVEMETQIAIVRAPKAGVYVITIDDRAAARQKFRVCVMGAGWSD